MEKYLSMLGFDSLEALQKEYSSEANESWENVARSLAQSASVAAGGQRPGYGSAQWNRDPGAVAPALPERSVVGEWTEELRGFALQLLQELKNNTQRAFGGQRETPPMATLEFQRAVFDYAENAIRELVLYVPATQAGAYQDGSPVDKANKFEGFYGTRSSLVPVILLQGLRSSKRSRGVTGVWVATNRGFCYEWGFTPFELFAGAAIHIAWSRGKIVSNRRT